MWITSCSALWSYMYILDQEMRFDLTSIQEHTEYSKQYIKKPMEACLAAVLRSGGRCGSQDCYTFVETDPTGHTWYKRDNAVPVQ